MPTEVLDQIEKLETSLREAADQLRANSKLTSSEYVMPVLGVIFLRHAANRFYAAKAAIEAELNEIRKNFTPSLGKDHGRVVLKSAKPHLEKRLESFKANLEAHQKTVADELQGQLDESRKQIVDYYLQHVFDNPPDAMVGQMLRAEPTEEDARRWLDDELNRIFPKAESLIQEMLLDVRYKDVTFETLNRPDFLESVQAAFPRVDWDKAYHEFRAAGESAPDRA